jgi:hypothetical protein
MLRRIPFSFLELRKVIYDSLHILYRAELRLTLLISEKLLHEVVYVLSDLAKVLVHDLSIKLVLVW